MKIKSGKVVYKGKVIKVAPILIRHLIWKNKAEKHLGEACCVFLIRRCSTTPLMYYDSSNIFRYRLLLNLHVFKNIQNFI